MISAFRTNVEACLRLLAEDGRLALWTADPKPLGHAALRSCHSWPRFVWFHSSVRAGASDADAARDSCLSQPPTPQPSSLFRLKRKSKTKKVTARQLRNPGKPARDSCTE